MATSRRQFLTTASGTFALVGGAGRLPSLMLEAAEGPNSSDGKILVVVQLSGGNDGLNTVVPFADDEYYANRFTLAIGRKSVLKINDSLGLHPSMKGMASLLESGQLAIINGVGYPSPNRSHFESMDLWHTAHRKHDSVPEGWLGRWIDDEGLEVGGLHLGGDELPLALRAVKFQAPSVRSIDEFRLRVRGDASRRELIHDLVAKAEASSPPVAREASRLLSIVQSSTKAALKMSNRMEEVASEPIKSRPFPNSQLGQKLASVAKMIRADLPARVYYVTLDGFDTHSNQRDAHAGLLTQMSDAVSAFADEMKVIGAGQRVLLFAFSEFGRRLRENASQGTDHGAAAPVFLAGEGVRPGMVGNYPSLTELEDGDLKFHTDYRSVYATLIQQWLGGDARQVLGGTFEPLDCLKT